MSCDSPVFVLYDDASKGVGVGLLVPGGVMCVAGTVGLLAKSIQRKQT